MKERYYLADKSTCEEVSLEKLMWLKCRMVKIDRSSLIIVTANTILDAMLGLKSSGLVVQD